jgi:hypothetical protein
VKYLTLWTALSGLCALSLVSPAKAQTCASYRTYRAPSYSYSYSTPTYYAPSYSTPSYSTPYVAPYVAPVVKKVVEHKDEAYYLKFIAVVPLVELPTYSAAYVPPYSPLQAPKKDDEQLKQILELLKSYDARFKALEGKASLPPQATQQAPGVTQTPKDGEQPKIPDVRAVNALKCAMCHERGKEANGGGLVLSEKNGSLVRLNNEQLGELDEQLSTNKMPKLNAKSKAAGITELADVEYASFRQEISRQRALNKTGKTSNKE